MTPADYYARRGVDLEPLRIPSTLADYFDAFERLSLEDQERFIRAEAWFTSSSLHFVALVSAIEALTEDPRIGEVP